MVLYYLMHSHINVLLLMLLSVFAVVVLTRYFAYVDAGGLVVCYDANGAIGVRDICRFDDTYR